MSERLHVTGIGSTREDALADALRQAEQWFSAGQAVLPTIGCSEALARQADGTVSAWAVDVDYEPISQRTPEESR